MLTLALIFMIGFTVLAVQVILWQSQDISVAIVSETEEGSKEVTISVRNTAGSTLLFYENTEMTGKIEYLSEEGWVEYCDVSYTTGNAQAISQLYGGTFAELEPGEDWSVTVPEDKVAGMKNGTYRIKMTYVTEKKYNEYLDSAFENRLESDEAEEITVSEDASEDISTDVSEEISDVVPEESKEDNFFAGLIPTFGIADGEEEDDEIIEEEYLAASVSEVFIKTFEYEVPEDFVSEISIDDSDIAHNDAKSGRSIIHKDDKLQ